MHAQAKLRTLLILLIFGYIGIAPLHAQVVSILTPADNGENWSKDCGCPNRLTQSDMAKATKHLSMDSYDEKADVNIDGTAVVELSVRSDGSVKCARAVSGHPLAMNQLISASDNWLFKPLMKNGTPVPFCGKVRVNYKIVKSHSSVELGKPEGV